MLVLLLCCIMKIFEYSLVRRHQDVEKTSPMEVEPRRPRRRYRRTRRHLRGKVMNEAECGVVDGGGAAKADCNSNHTTASGPVTTATSTASCLSNASSQDIDFIQDNSEYQWFLDYGYRDGNSQHHTSVLSSLTESYGGEPEQFGYYDVLSKNLDANLAEADMESFRTEDIHALLTTLPTMCTDMQLVSDTNHQGEMFASVSGSMMAKFDFDSSVSPHSSSQGEGDGDDSVASPDTMSICKSELLFSPVKETPMPGVNFSVDSLDCDLEHDIMLTCQANKDNYTIAFEGSVTMYSEESDDFHDGDKSNATNSSDNQQWSTTHIMNKRHQKLLDTSMARSDSGLTTWSKLKKRTSETQLRRHPSGNNNNVSGDETVTFNNLKNDNALKSQSMPNLHKQKFRIRQDSAVPFSSNEGMCSSSTESSSLLQRQSHLVKVFDIQHQTNRNPTTGSCYSDMAISLDGEKATKPNISNKNTSANNKSQQSHNISLVKLFIKQKSLSAERMSCAMDQSSASECWPASHSDDSDSFEVRTRRMTQSGCGNSAPECSGFLDSLVGHTNQPLSGERIHDLIREEIEDGSERSESVEQLSESASHADSIYSFDNDKPFTKLLETFSGNNNNSIEQDFVKRRLCKRGTQTKRSKDVGDSSSSGDSTNFSLMMSKPTTIVMAKQKGTQYPVHLMNRSMQTSRLVEPHFKFMRSGSKNDLYRVVEPSFLSKLKQQGEGQKPVYVIYPNYTLPDLEFLKEKREDTTKVFLLPQKYPKPEDCIPNPQSKDKKVSTNLTSGPRSRRPFSCNDMELLKKKGFAHVRDWDSLTFLLPVECRQVLTDVPEYMKVLGEREKLGMQRQKTRPLSCDYGSLIDRSSSSTATQPSSGYRGSSTMLTDSSQNSPAPKPASGYRGSSMMLTDSSQNNPAPIASFNPLFVYRYDSATSSEASLMMSEKHRSATTPPVPKRSISLTDKAGLKKGDCAPPRPPLPKGILRKSSERKNTSHSKRYSMFEMGTNYEDDYIRRQPLYYDDDTGNFIKRQSLHEPYFQQRTFSEHSTETEDEGVEAGHATDSSLDERFENMEVRPPTPPLPKANDNPYNLGNISCNELEQLEEYLKMSGISYSDHDDWDENELLRLRSHVNKFLSLKINKDAFDSNLLGKKCVSFAEKVVAHDEKLYSTPPNSPNVSALLHRHYQGKTLVDMPICEETELSPDGYCSPQLEPEKLSPIDLSQKIALISAVTQSVEQLIHHFSAANDQDELNALGDSELNPACAKLVLSSLCPALYTLFSDGLKPCLDTTFGRIGNSVWQVVEASAQQGPLTKALNELVMRINEEDVITEGLLKFNAFVFGLLNVRSLDAWASYLRTRETILRKHYSSDSLMVLAQTGGANVRSLLDKLIATLQPLALLPFQIDLLFEYRQLHLSLKRMDSYHQPSSPTHLRISPLAHLTNKQLTLMKLVRSVQSNMSQSYDDTEEISVATMIRKQSPDNSDTTSDPSLPDLLSSSAKTKSKDEKPRPRSCVDAHLAVTNTSGFKPVDDVAGTLKKRWSGIHLGSKFVQAFERFTDETEEEYTDSLEHNGANARTERARNGRDLNGDGSSSPAPSLQDDGPESLDSQCSDNKPLNGGRFRRLQLKWEMLSGKEVTPQTSPLTSPSHTSSSKSKIPRLVNSPVKSGIPVLSPSFMKTGLKLTTTQPSKKQPVAGKASAAKNNSGKKLNIVATRASRLDQAENPESRIHPVRPSSLPYRPVSTGQGTKGMKLTPPRRAVSSSVTRKTQPQTKTPKVVRTLTHRLPSDNGHLSFNEGDKLKVILEVDSKWLLCCRGDLKGLVPRSAVLPVYDSGGGRI